jgi:hypothetical protein
VYAVDDMDGGPSRTLTGRALMDEGLEIRTAEKPAAVTLCYAAKKPESRR